MAGEEKATQATAKSVGDWVGAFYGDDAIDLSKATKVKHLIATGQFASVVYVVSKNTKLAHTDLSESAYTAIDTMYAAAAELIIKLLHRKYKEGGRALTASDFEDCGGRALFGKSPNYDQICNDYIKKDGMVDTAQKVLPVYESDEGTAKCYGRIVDDMTAVRRDHTYLLSVTGSKNGTLSREQIFNIYDATTDNSIKTWKKLKDTKSKGDFKLQEMMEDAYLLKYDLAKKSAKVGIVLGSFTYALGAMAGGLIFVPALFAIGSYALGKRWIPDWFKSAGAAWAGVEKRYQKRREIKRAMAHMDWLVRFVETGGKPKNGRTFKQVMSDMRYVRPEDVSALKKQGKTLGFTTVEGLDGNPIIGDTQRAKEAFHEAGEIVNLDSDLVSPESADEISKFIGGIKKENATFGDFNKISNIIIKAGAKLPESERQAVLKEYAAKLLECAPTLIFKNNFESGTDYQDKISQYLAETYPILEVLKDFDPNTIAKVRRLVTLSSKELTGLNEEYIGGPLEDYIKRVPTSKMEVSDTGLALLENRDVMFDLTGVTISPTADNHMKAAVAMIASLQLKPGDDRLFEVEGHPEFGIADITREIAQVVALDTAPIDVHKAAENARNELTKALNKQMGMIVYSKQRKDSRVTYEAVLAGNYAGKLSLDDTFKKFGEITFENIDSFSTLYLDMAKTEPKEVRDYMRGKFAKQIYDIMKAYAGAHASDFRKDLSQLAEYLRKVNSCEFLNEQQKMDLSANATSLIQESFVQKVKNLPEIFRDKYDQQEYLNYLKSYASGGFEELFESNQSSEVQGVKAGIEYMIELAGIHQALNFGGSYKMSQVESQYIARTFLLSRESGGQYPSIRTKDDPLRNFIDTNIGNMQTSFTGDIMPVSTDSGSDYETRVRNQLAYRQIESSLKEVLDWSVVNSDGELDENKLYDQYTALVILKNKAISIFRNCMKTLVSIGSSGQIRSSWISANAGLIDNMKSHWGRRVVNDDRDPNYSNIDDADGILVKIDKALAMPKFNEITKVNGNNAINELSRYGTSDEIESMLSQQQL